MYASQEYKEESLSGIEPCFQGSLGFVMINNILFLEGGKAIDVKGNMLLLPKHTYKVLEDISLEFFENHVRYYFYIQEKSLVPTTVLALQSLEKEVNFFISKQKYSDAILLAEVEIDYTQKHPNVTNNIHIPLNVFMPQKNEIDICLIPRLSVSESENNYRSRLDLAEEIYLFAKYLHHKIAEPSHVSFATLSSAFFQLSEEMHHLVLHPYGCYQKLAYYTKLLRWVERSLWLDEEYVHIEALLQMFVGNSQAYSQSFYTFSLENQDGFFYKIVEHLSQLTTLSAHPTQKISPLPKQRAPEDTDEKNMPSSLVVEFGQEPDETSTNFRGLVLKKCVRVGRGRESDNDIILGEEDRTVSRCHLEITKYDEGFHIEDLSSRGTYIDEVPIGKNNKKFVENNRQYKIVLGTNACMLDLNHDKIQALLST